MPTSTAERPTTSAEIHSHARRPTGRREAHPGIGEARPMTSPTRWLIRRRGLARVEADAPRCRQAAATHAVATREVVGSHVAQVRAPGAEGSLEAAHRGDQRHRRRGPGRWSRHRRRRPLGLGVKRSGGTGAPSSSACWSAPPQARSSQCSRRRSAGARSATSWARAPRSWRRRPRTSGSRSSSARRTVRAMPSMSRRSRRVPRTPRTPSRRLPPMPATAPETPASRRHRRRPRRSTTRSTPSDRESPA